MFGLRNTAAINRRTMTGQTASGMPVIGATTVWTGPCFVHQTAGHGKWRDIGLVGIGMYAIYLPYLTGSARPVIGDTITVGTDGYRVEFVDPPSSGLNHHLEVVGRRAEP